MKQKNTSGAADWMIMNDKLRHLHIPRILYPAVFFIAVALYFGVFHRFHLLYTEGMQLFLFSRDYFTETVLHPGGLADYASRFLIQFYRAPAVGGMIIALLLVLLQEGVYKIASNLVKGNVSVPLSFVPSVFYWILLCNPNYTLAGLLALVAMVWIAYIYTCIREEPLCAVYVFFSLPAAWLLFGGAFPAAFLIILLAELKMPRKKIRHTFPAIAGGLVLTVGLLLFTDLQRTPSAVFYGADYYRFSDYPHWVFISLWAAFPLILLAMMSLKKGTRIWNVLLTVLLTGATAWGLMTQWRGDKEKELAYLFAARRMDWQRVLSMSQKNLPNSLLALNMFNLALAVTDQAGDLMFSVPQTTSGALVLPEDMDMIFSSEIWFNLGMINESKRYAYESMMAVPDKQKSSLFLMRLAESELIAGNYKVARKYLNVLMKAPFYRKWAGRRLALCGNEKAIEAHPVYGLLRSRQPNCNIKISAAAFSESLQNIFADKPNNPVAVNYCLMDRMLQKDIPGFCDIYALRSLPVPRHYQEVLLLACHMGGTDPATLSIPLDQNLQKNLERFVSETNISNPDRIEALFGQTFWYYAYFIQ
ncbi:MAG: DUF6057 family protein [Bacteroidales bacterium]